MNARRRQHWRIPFSQPDIREMDVAAVREALLVTGPGSSHWLDRFESRLARHTGTRHAVGVSSGTAGLELALRALDIGPGDEVVLAALGYVATANAVCHTGATPVFVDSDETTLAIDPHALAAAMTPATRAVVVTHLFGLPAAMPAIMTTASRHGAAVVEDACQALGTRLAGEAAGSLGRLGVFSFSATKPVTAGEGGAVITGDPILADRVQRLRNHARDPDRADYTEIGLSARLAEPAAALAWAQLERLPESVLVRQQVADRYHDALGNCRELRLPAVSAGARISWFGYPLRLKEAQRDPVLAALNDAGIEARAYFQPLHQYKAHRGHPRVGELAVAEAAGRELLTLPLHAGLTAAHVDTIVAALRGALAAPRSSRRDR